MEHMSLEIPRQGRYIGEGCLKVAISRLSGLHVQLALRHSRPATRTASKAIFSTNF